jgi:hypothetical protein
VQKVDEKQNPRASVTVRPNAQLEISELSPDDDVGVTSDETGKPPVSPSPPPPPSPPPLPPPSS